MASIYVVYWSGTGNTEKMAELITEGATKAGASVVCKNVSDADASELADYDIVAFGSPAMGAEVIEEGEMEPFFSGALPGLKDRKVALFGSYSWADGEWMRTWAERTKDGGAVLFDDGLIVYEMPEGEKADECIAWGGKLAGF